MNEQAIAERIAKDVVAVKFDLSLARKDRLMAVIGLEFAKGSPSNPDYVLDSDGWFRKEYGAAKGYGLMIRGITAGSKNLLPYSEHFRVHRATVTFMPVGEDADDPALYEKAKMYVWVHRNYTISEVLQYIKANMRFWYP